MRVDLPLNKKTVESQNWAVGPSGALGLKPLGLLLVKPVEVYVRKSSFLHSFRSRGPNDNFKTIGTEDVNDQWVRHAFEVVL